MRYTHILTATATALLAEPALSATWAPRGEAAALRKRVSCGEGVGNCPDDECCSEAGYCGKETDYCKSPQCQIEFSNGNCDADEKPCGETTLDIPRNNNGEAPLDTIIKSCTKDSSIALTFDDGPYLYTNDLLDLLNSYNAKATFFVTGNNLGKGRIDDPSTEWPSILRRIHADGHQVASHTWSHEDLSLASPERRNSELGYNEMAFRNVLGFFPTYMRPPKGSCTRDSGCLDRATELGIHVVNWDLDTKDFQNNTPNTIQKSKDIFDEGVKAKNIVLSHDIQEQTVLELAEHMLKKAQAEGWTFETVGGCLGDAEENWYIQSAASESCAVPEGSDGGNEGRDEDDNEPNPDLEPSKDGTCGERSDGKYTCKDSDYGDCCSYNGFCGATSGYCDGGCQNTFGSCNKWECGDEPIVSENGLCGGDTFQTCAGSSYGNCCSIHGNCGDTEDYCQEDEGCQPEWGNCE